jgi:RNA polymerase sigma-70 factor, ECF subfamily
MNTGTAPRATPDPLSDIYLRMHGQIRRFVASRIPDPEQAEDLVHDVFLQVHDRIGSLRNSEKLDAWIYQITRNRIADHYRRQSRKADPEMPDYLARPEKRDELMKQLEPDLRDMIQQLPARYRDVLLLTELEDLPHRVVAGRLQISVSAVKSRVLRGRAMLKEQLMKCCHFEFDREGRVMDYEPRRFCPDCVMNDTFDAT